MTKRIPVGFIELKIESGRTMNGLPILVNVGGIQSVTKQSDGHAFITISAAPNDCFHVMESYEVVVALIADAVEAVQARIAHPLYITRGESLLNPKKDDGRSIK